MVAGIKRYRAKAGSVWFLNCWKWVICDFNNPVVLGKSGGTCFGIIWAVENKVGLGQLETLKCLSCKTKSVSLVEYYWKHWSVENMIEVLSVSKGQVLLTYLWKWNLPSIPTIEGQGSSFVLFTYIYPLIGIIRSQPFYWFTGNLVLPPLLNRARWPAYNQNKTWLLSAPGDKPENCWCFAD